MALTLSTSTPAAPIRASNSSEAAPMLQADNNLQPAPTRTTPPGATGQKHIRPGSPASDRAVAKVIEQFAKRGGVDLEVSDKGMSQLASLFSAEMAAGRTPLTGPAALGAMSRWLLNDELVAAPG